MVMNNNKNLVGSVFDGFEVVRRAFVQNKKVYWELRCKNCGHLIISTRSKLNLRTKPLKCEHCGNNDITFNKILGVMTDTPNNFTKETKFVPTKPLTSSPINNISNSEHTKDKFCAGFTENFNESFNNKEDEENKETIISNANDTSTNNYKNANVTIVEEIGEMFDVPAWYYIAHCIPADLSFGGYSANIINEKWNMKHLLELYYEGLAIELGDCLFERNVFNLVVSSRKYTKASLEALKEAVRKMAKMCFNEDVRYLAMPYIGCGSNGLNWEDVYFEIKNAFENIYNGSNKSIHITVYSYAE